MILQSICNYDNHIKFTCNIMLSHWLALIVVPTPPYTLLQAYPRAPSKIKYNIPHNCLNGTYIYYLSSVILIDYFLLSMSWSILSIVMLLFNSITFFVCHYLKSSTLWCIIFITSNYICIAYVVKLFLMFVYNVIHCACDHVNQ